MTDETSRSRSGPQQVTEIWELIVAYTKQETVDPLKSLGRYLAWGLGGALLLGIGGIFLTLAALRALQTETDTTFTGHWSWAPYGIVVIGLLLISALVWWGRGARKKDRS